MATILICNWTSQDAIRKLPLHFKQYFDNLSAEIQIVNLKKLLGIEFYNDLIENKGNYTELLEGCSFEISGYTYKQEGLIVFLAHLIAAEFQTRGKFHETATGVIIKTDQDYQQISAGSQKQLKNDLQEYAMTFWTEIERYLLNSTTQYPLFRINSRPNSVYSPEIFKIG